MPLTDASTHVTSTGSDGGGGGGIAAAATAVTLSGHHKLYNYHLNCLVYRR